SGNDATSNHWNRQEKRIYTRISVDYKHKLEVLKRLALQPKVDQKQLSKWKKQASFIKAVCEEGKWHFENYRKVGAATVLNRDRRGHRAVERKEGRLSDISKNAGAKALEVAADEGISPDVISTSYSWGRRFMRRHKFSMRVRTRQGQTPPEDAASAKAKFRAVFFEYLPRKTITTRGEKTEGWCPSSSTYTGRERRDEKWIWRAIMKGYFPLHNEHIWRTILKGYLPLQNEQICRIYGKQTARWSADILLKFRDCHCGHRDYMNDKVLSCEAIFQIIGLKKSSITQHQLTLSYSKYHPNFTYVWQPADVARNRPFKPRLQMQDVARIKTRKRRLRARHFSWQHLNAKILHPGSQNRGENLLADLLNPTFYRSAGITEEQDEV
ncbi:hypothetical protein GN958_ATG06542, partial [Phytophthora infestans]